MTKVDGEGGDMVKSMKILVDADRNKIPVAILSFNLKKYSLCIFCARDALALIKSQ